MNNRLEYGGFIILALPYQLGDDNRWTLNIQIELHTGDRVVSRSFSTIDTFETRDEALNIQIELHTADRVVSRPFSTIDTFETRDEAISHCFQFGRRIIDGSEPGLSVVDMA